MSDPYRPICISHNPGIVIRDVDWQDHLTLEGALANPAQLADLGHPHCEMVGGRYSYPLIELYCPPRRDDQPRLSGHPAAGHWIDVEWLHLILLAHQAGLTLPRSLPECWSPARLERIPELAP